MGLLRLYAKNNDSQADLDRQARSPNVLKGVELDRQIPHLDMKYGVLCFIATGCMEAYVWKKTIDACCSASRTPPQRNQNHPHADKISC